MKVGDRIRIFEVLDPFYGNLKGKQAAEKNGNFFGNMFGVDLPLDFVNGNLHVGINDRMQARQVATMVITKIKS